MHRFKRLCSLLCLLLVFSVGFLSVNSTIAYASEGDGSSTIPLIANDYLDMTARDLGWDPLLWQGAGSFDSNTNTY